MNSNKKTEYEIEQERRAEQERLFVTQPKATLRETIKIIFKALLNFIR